MEGDETSHLEMCTESFRHPPNEDVSEDKADGYNMDSFSSLHSLRSDVV